MGVKIAASIVVASAAAVYGIARLKDASQQAATQIGAVNAAGAKTGVTMGKLINAFRIVRSGTAAVTGAGTTNRFKSALFGSNNKGVISNLFGQGKNPTASAEELRKAIKTNVGATNTLVGVAREARNWYKVLFRTADKGGHNRGLKKIAAVTALVSKGAEHAQRSVDKVSDSYDNLSAMAGGALAAVGGTALLSGAGGLLERSFDLSRGKEDSAVTFDTLLGAHSQTEKLMGGITKYAAVTPFQKDDIVGASKSLLSVSGKDIEKNEKLYKLAGQIAALKPGSSVEDVAHGIVSGAFGEFEILKGFTFNMRAEMFKKSGKAGGKEYGDAVVKELEAQLLEKTGGRDLVAALSGTMTGLMSTIKDSLDEPLASIGTAITEKLNIKSLMGDYIKEATIFGEYLGAMLSGQMYTGETVPPGLVALSQTIEDMVYWMGYVGTRVTAVVKGTLSWFNGLDSGTQTLLSKVLLIGGGLTTGLGIVVPLLTGIIGLAGAVGGPITAVITFVAGLTSEIGVLSFGIMALGTMFVTAGLAATFMLFRREGESLYGTVKRLGTYMANGLATVWKYTTVYVGALYETLSNAFLPAWYRLEAAFGSIRPYFVDIITMFGGTGISMDDVARIGYRLGDALVWMADKAVELTEMGIKGLNLALEFASPMFKHTISDLKLMGLSIVKFLAGTTSGMVTARTLFRGMIDIVLSPFTLIISQMELKIAEALHSAAETVRPMSSTLADLLDEASTKSKEASASTLEGFLKTREDILGRDTGITAKIDGSEFNWPDIKLNLDGERVGEAKTRRDARTRNSGRGGDPMSPEQMGFAINDGKIRTVGLADVARGG